MRKLENEKEKLQEMLGRRVAKRIIAETFGISVASLYRFLRFG